MAAELQLEKAIKRGAPWVIKFILSTMSPTMSIICASLIAIRTWGSIIIY